MLRLGDEARGARPRARLEDAVLEAHVGRVRAGVGVRAHAADHDQARFFAVADHVVVEAEAVRRLS